MTKPQGSPKRVAILIDADNVPAGVLGDVMDAARMHGTIIVGCAYRHWTDQTRKGWEAGCRMHGIQMVEQAPGPNATDIALAIDAVDLLRDRGLDVVCVVSGDRDFAPLAARLRRSRLTAVLMADPAKVKESNRALWHAFVPLAVTPTKSAKPPVVAATKLASPKPASPEPIAPKPAAGSATPTGSPLVQAVLARLADQALKKDAGGWVILNEIGKGIAAELKKPSLRKALEAAADDKIEIENRSVGGKAGATQWVRRRPGTV